MAHSLRLKVVAEGVETREQLEFLRVHGCDEIQGYLLSKPVPPDEFAAKFRQTIPHEVPKRIVARPPRRNAAHAQH